MSLSRILTALLYLAAGGALFLVLLNRLCLHAKDGPLKSALIGAVLGLCTLGAVGLGLWLEPGRAAAAPAAVLALLGLGELHRGWLRRRTRRAPRNLASLKAGRSLGRAVTTRALELHRYDLQLPSYRGRTLRIALVSDLHVDPALGLDYYREALARVSAEQPDLVLLAGDFVTRTENAALLPELLRDLRPRVGSYAVLGNHDHWADAASVRDALLRSGVQLLSPSGIRVALGEGAGESVLLSGCEDPWGGEAWSAPAQRLEGEALLVVSHSADAIYRLARAGADAVFAGHYHAGQIRLPGLGALVLPSIYGRRYDHGCFSVDGCELFVSAGVGAMGLPLRIYCPPDVFLIELRGGDAG